MKKSQIDKTFENYIDWNEKYIAIVGHIVNDDGVLPSKSDQCEVMEAFALKICTQWSILCEELLIDALNHDASQYGKYMNLRIPKHNSRDTCEAMIAGLSYFDFKSMRELENVARNILVPNYNLFSVVSRQMQIRIDEFILIRNFIAHGSNKAERALLKMYKDRWRMERFREPGDFLLSFDPKSRQRRINIYLKNFNNTVRAMMRFWFS